MRLVGRATREQILTDVRQGARVTSCYMANSRFGAPKRGALPLKCR
jgi:hypothetical protein